MPGAKKVVSLMSALGQHYFRRSIWWQSMGRYERLKPYLSYLGSNE